MWCGVELQEALCACLCVCVCVCVCVWCVCVCVYAVVALTSPPAHTSAQHNDIGALLLSARRYSMAW